VYPQTADDLTADLSAPAGSSDSDKDINLLARQLVEDAINSAQKSLDGNSPATSLLLSKISDTDGSCGGPNHVSEPFKFDASVLCDKDRPLPEWCYLCRQDGHLSENCVDDEVLNLPPLPKMSLKLKELLDKACLDVQRDLAATEKEEDQKKLVLHEIHKFVSHEYPECNLALFGSSENGFGFRNSDMDICLTHPSKTLDAVEVVSKLAQGMKTRKQEYREVLAIPTAKVPIVKFVHSASGMEGDISLDNVLVCGRCI
jgi:predicted nucleotidyltransferase